MPQPTLSEVPEQRRGTVLNAERLRRLAEVRMSAAPRAQAENAQLKRQVRQLRVARVTLMVKHGEI
ncbi:MAG: hypothetical protein ABI356_10280 [Steroidobacteraceae bacterium]